MDKHWHVLQVNPELKERFQSSPIIAFRKNKNLKQIIGSNTIEHNKKLIRSNNKVNGKSSPCLCNTRTLCCKQVVSTTSIKSNQTNHVFNIRLNNHRKDVKDPNALPADKHFTLPGHDFNKNAKLALIEKLTNTNKVATETLKERLRNRENFWIIKLRSLTTNGINQELN